MAKGKFSKPRFTDHNEDLTQAFTPISETEAMLHSIDSDQMLSDMVTDDFASDPLSEYSIPEQDYPDPINPQYNDSEEDEDYDDEESIFAKHKTLILVSICSAVLVLLVGIIVGVSMFLNAAEDDGLILNNVTVAGVNIGGMTKEQAAATIRGVTNNTYTIKDMVINMPDQTLVLSPKDTGARLDVEAAVNAAYRYGRTGTKQEQKEAREKSLYGNHTIALLPYLNLDLDYIQSVLDDYGNNFNSTYAPSSYEFQGTKPVLTGEDFDPDADCEALIIHVGSPGRNLDIEKIYNEVLDAYSFNRFVVDAQESAPQEHPDPIDLDEIYKEYCSEPIDAVMDEDTFEVTPETYGYSFNLARAKELLAEAEPGSSFGIPMMLVEPAVLSDDLSGKMYRDVLGSFETPTTDDENRNSNLKLACAAIDGMVLEPGDIFDYNVALGERTEEAGYKGAAAYADGQTVSQIGGGICQVSSTLYYCTLEADLKIIKRSPHSYVSNYMPMGMDAAVSWGGPEFIFQNNTNYPIRIDAEVKNDKVCIKLVGTDEKDYYIKMEYEIIGTRYPDTVYEEYEKDNPKGYWDGQVIQTAYTGYSVKTYKCKYNKETDELISREFDVTSVYKHRDQVIVKIVEPEPTPPETTPTDPTDPPQETTPVVPTAPPSEDVQTDVPITTPEEGSPET